MNTQTTPVVFEYKPVSSIKYDGRKPLWQLMVLQRSEPNEKGAVYKKIVDVQEHHNLATLRRRATKKYEGRIVEELDLSPVQPALF